MSINPYTTESSIFTDLIPYVPPEVVDTVAVASFSFNPIELSLVAVALATSTLYLYSKTQTFDKKYESFTAKRNRRHYFRVKEIADSTLVSNLLELLKSLDAVNINGMRESNLTFEPLKGRVIMELEHALETITPPRRIQKKDPQLGVYIKRMHLLDTNLIHEQYLMETLVDYLKEEPVPDCTILEPHLHTILKGVTEAIDKTDETHARTSKAVEMANELRTYNSLKEKQAKEDAFATHSPFEGYRGNLKPNFVPEPVPKPEEDPLQKLDELMAELTNQPKESLDDAIQQSERNGTGILTELTRNSGVHVIEGTPTQSQQHGTETNQPVVTRSQYNPETSPFKGSTPLYTMTYDGVNHTLRDERTEHMHHSHQTHPSTESKPPRYTDTYSSASSSSDSSSSDTGTSD